MVVRRYRVDANNNFYIKMPEGAKILGADILTDNICVWALVDSTKPIEEKRYFRLAGTDHPIPESLEDLIYISTFNMPRMVALFHLFEIVNSKNPDEPVIAVEHKTHNKMPRQNTAAHEAALEAFEFLTEKLSKWPQMAGYIEEAYRILEGK